MTVINVNEMAMDAFHLVQRQNTPSSTTSSPPNPTITSPFSTTSSASGGGGSGSSPLLFFVALGFGVVFTNLWIIVGVKYCFRYNARNRARRNGEVVDPINLENMAARPHRRRREKKLMTMEEVNERFPLTKYKTWVASRASEGLPTEGGVDATPSRAASLRNAEGAITTTPKHADAVTESEVVNEQKSMYTTTTEKASVATDEERNDLEPVATASIGDKLPANSENDEEEDEDDHIHTAVPPELLANPGDSCAICIDTLEEDDDIRGLTCGHAFHAGCLDPWLTSRRACCPLCKADYYVPKPRPEGEIAEPERTARRRDRNVPQPPQSAWTGIRGNPRMMLTGRGRLVGPGYPGDATYSQGPRMFRSRQEPQEGGDSAPSSRWRPRNPFAGMTMPRLPIPGRARLGQNTTETTEAQPSPSQLESGTVVR